MLVGLFENINNEYDFYILFFVFTKKKKLLSTFREKETILKKKKIKRYRFDV